MHHRDEFSAVIVYRRKVDCSVLIQLRGIMKNLFIDTNIWLSLYHFTNDDLTQFQKLGKR